MKDQSGRTLLSVVAALSVVFSLWSLVPAHSSPSSYGCCLNESGCNVVLGFDCIGDFTDNMVCGGANSTACVQPEPGCCESDPPDCAGLNEAECFVLQTCDENVTQIGCLMKGGNFFADSICDVANRTKATTSYSILGSCVPNRPDGGTCALPSECASGNCVEGTCCNSACDGATQSCSQPGFEGTCREGAMAPAASNLGLVALVVVLAGLGAFVVTRRRGAGVPAVD